MNKNIERSKAEKRNLLKPLKLELQNNPKLIKKEIKECNKGLKVTNKIEKNKEKIMYSSFSGLNKSIIKISSNQPSLNSTNNESSLLVNNQKYINKMNSYSQCHNYFQIIPKIKSESPRIKKTNYKLPKNNKLISLRRNKKTHKDEIKLEKKALIFAVNKKNPCRLLESIIKIINPDKTLFEKKLRNFSNKNSNFMKWILLKHNNKKEKRHMNNLDKNTKANLFQNNSICSSNFNKTEYFLEKRDKKNGNVSNNNTIEQSIDNNHIKKIEKNSLLMRIRNYRSKTEKMNSAKYGIYTQKNKNNINYNTFGLSVTKMTESNFLESKFNTEEQKEDNKMLKSQYFGSRYRTIKKKEFADASCDTNLDRLFDNICNNNKKLDIIKKTKIEFDSSNCNEKNLNKSFFPKRILYKNNKYFHKLQKKGSNNLNLSLQKSINCYNFNNIINLFDKKISLENNSKINYFKNFRNRSFKFYSSCNNSNISLIKREIFKKEKYFL